MGYYSDIEGFIEINIDDLIAGKIIDTTVIAPTPGTAAGIANLIKDSLGVQVIDNVLTVEKLLQGLNDTRGYLDRKTNIHLGPEFNESDIQSGTLDIYLHDRKNYHFENALNNLVTRFPGLVERIDIDYAGEDRFDVKEYKLSDDKDRVLTRDLILAYGEWE